VVLGLKPVETGGEVVEETLLWIHDDETQLVGDVAPSRVKVVLLSVLKAAMQREHQRPGTLSFGGIQVTIETTGVVAVGFERDQRTDRESRPGERPHRRDDDE